MNASDTIKAVRNKARHLLIGHLTYEHAELQRQILKNRQLLGRIYAKDFTNKRVASLDDVEFQVSSQFREDGIIQYLVKNMPIPNPICVEIGCGNFAESNTKFLIENDHWRAVVIDKMPDHVHFLASDDGKYIHYAHDVQPIVAEVEPSNINAVLKDADIHGDIGLLSIDIDGMDYWVLKSIRDVSPRIIVVEYNSVFGSKHAVTVPYATGFSRLDAHNSGLYFGASLQAFVALLKKTHVFVGSNSTGNNAFFVRKDLSPFFRALSKNARYVESQFCDSLDSNQQLTYVRSHTERVKLIADMPLVNLQNGKTMRCKDIVRNSSR